MSIPFPYRLLAIVVLVFLVSSCHVPRFFYWNFAGINDVEKFPTRSIDKGESTFYFAQSEAPLQTEKINSADLEHDLLTDVEDAGTVAFLVIRNDTILLEKYFGKYEDTTLLTSFSAAKSFVSALVGIAVKEGHIKSTQQTVGDYLDFIKDEEVKKVTIENLLNMTSGIKYNEGYFNPFGDVAVSYYGTNLKRHVSKLDIKDPQGEKFKYISVNTQLLAMIVESATGQSLNEFTSEKIWKPIQAEFDASWSTDSKKNQTEKTFCCWNARARDYAKLGRLYLNKGKWNDQQIVPEEWVDKSMFPEKHGIRPYYSYQWWHTVKHTSRETGKEYIGDESFKLFMNGTFGDTTKHKLTVMNDFYARGILGQFIYVYPEKNIIIVRIGKKVGGINWPRLFLDMADQL